MGHQQVNRTAQVVVVGGCTSARRFGSGSHFKSVLTLANQSQSTTDKLARANLQAGNLKSNGITACTGKVEKHDLAVQRFIVIAIEPKHQVGAFNAQANNFGVKIQNNDLPCDPVISHGLAWSRPRNDQRSLRFTYTPNA